MRRAWTTTEISVMNRLTVLGATQRAVGLILGRTPKSVERKVARIRTKFSRVNYRDALVTMGYASDIR